MRQAAEKDFEDAACGILEDHQKICPGWEITRQQWGLKVLAPKNVDSEKPYVLIHFVESPRGNSYNLTSGFYRAGIIERLDIKSGWVDERMNVTQTYEHPTSYRNIRKVHVLSTTYDTSNNRLVKAEVTLSDRNLGAQTFMSELPMELPLDENGLILGVPTEINMQWHSDIITAVRDPLEENCARVQMVCTQRERRRPGEELPSRTRLVQDLISFRVANNLGIPILLDMFRQRIALMSLRPMSPISLDWVKKSASNL